MPAVTSCLMLNQAYVGKQILDPECAEERMEWVIFNDRHYWTAKISFRHTLLCIFMQQNLLR